MLTDYICHCLYASEHEMTRFTEMCTELILQLHLQTSTQCSLYSSMMSHLYYTEKGMMQRRESCREINVHDLSENCERYVLF